jgi:hypothetical protein
MEMPTFDGTNHISAKAWVQKLDAYLQLNTMEEGNAIKYATLHLMGKAHDWWFHGMTTLGHEHVTSYLDFTQRLIDRFDREDPELHFRELTQIKQTGSPEAFIEEFQKVAVKVPDMSESRLLMIYTEALNDPLHGWVKAFKPATLHDAIEHTRDLTGAASKNKFTPKPPTFTRGRDTKKMDKGKGKMDEATRRELRRKQLCFTCKESWQPGHKCWSKGKIHYIEVVSDSEDESDGEESGAIHNIQLSHKETEQALHVQGEEVLSHQEEGLKKVTIASMSGVPKFNTFRMKGVVQGQWATVLIDGGASHNFIDVAMVERRHIPTVDFEGFLVEVAGGRTIACDKYIPQMSLTLGRYTLIQDFYVVDIPDTNIILGVQWLSTLGPITTNYKTMEMSFTTEEGKRVTLKGMTGESPRVVTAKKMHAIFRHEEVAYATKCFVMETRGRRTQAIPYGHAKNPSQA